MKRVSQIIWGVIIVAIGVIFALNAFDITNIDIFFDGWWTLFIIVPCAVALFTKRDKGGAILGILGGVALLLACQNVVSFSLLWKLVIPFIIVRIGLRLIFRDAFDKQSREAVEKVKATGAPARQVCATFSGQDLNYEGEVVENTELTAVFGGIDCNMSQAIIPGDVLIKAVAVCGGVDLYLPVGGNVKVRSNSLFGGVDNKRTVAHIEGAPTVYVEATCLFGGMEIK